MNVKNAITRLERFTAGIPRAVAKHLAPMLEARTRAMRDGQTDPYGKALAPLADSTIRKKGGDSRILRDTNQADAETYVLNVGPQIVFRYGEVYQYAQNGAPNRPVRLVAPIYGIPKTWTQDMKVAQAMAAKEALK